MPGSRKIKESAAFDCPLYGGRVSVNFYYFEITSRGHLAGRSDAGFDCSHFMHCPVGRPTAPGVGAIDWQRCAHEGLRAKARR